MPGETKIFKNSSGWYNVEKPGVYHRTRDAARIARKTTITNTPSTVTSHTTPVSLPDGGTVSAFTGRDPHTQDLTFAGISLGSLTRLQQRLFNRLMSIRGVDATDALSVITSNGYNAAASYGHMREAGATHAEALSVIWLGSPSVSLAYGQHRAVGYDHADALRDALVIGDVDDGN